MQTDATDEWGAAERCRVVDLIKINTVRQESNHKEREEEKNRGVALMGSMDGASVQGQWLCPWWPIPHWLDDSHQGSSLTYSHPFPLFPPFSSPPRSVHSVLSGGFKNLFACFSPWSDSPPDSRPAVPLTHLLFLHRLSFPPSSTSISGDKTTLTEYSVPDCWKRHNCKPTTWQSFYDAQHWHTKTNSKGALSYQSFWCHITHYD